MLRAEDVEFFVLLAASDSLSAAARKLNVSASAVSQRLQALEHRLGVRLIHRVSGQTELTEEGELLALRSASIVEELNSLKDILAARRRIIVGNLRIIAPLGFGRRYIAPIVSDFRGEHPEVSLDLMLTDRLGRLPTGSWDIAFHVGELDTAASSLTVRKLAPNRRHLCASRSYVERYGLPQTVSELPSHQCIVLQEDYSDGAVWRLRPAAGGPEERIRVNPALTTNDGEVAKNWALAGLGVLLRSEWDVAEELKTGALQRVLAQYTCPDADVVALLPSSRGTRPARTQTFLEFVQCVLASTPWRDGS